MKIAEQNLFKCDTALSLKVFYIHVNDADLLSNMATVTKNRQAQRYLKINLTEFDQL